MIGSREKGSAGYVRHISKLWNLLRNRRRHPDELARAGLSGRFSLALLRLACRDMWSAAAREAQLTGRHELTGHEHPGAKESGGRGLVGSRTRHSRNINRANPHRVDGQRQGYPDRVALLCWFGIVSAGFDEL